ncbi:MAG: substrate-binding periplasmic protein [Shimia sp.]|uniref:substrate-binding periplasmic protein n=1 Tax=Shimia sp. TaxID=1954381 RepID=UPI004059D3ED
MKTLAICALALTTATVAQAADVKLFTEDYAPYNYLDNGELTGHGVDIIKEALSRSGVTADMEVTKWSRAISKAEQDADTCVFTTARTPEREERFNWAGPMYSEAIYLIQKIGANADVDSVDAALTQKIGTQTGDFAVALMDRMGATDIDLAPDAEMTLKKLRAGRVDYMVALESAAKVAIDGGGIEIAMEVSRNEFFMACSKTTNGEVIAKMDAAIGSILADGTQAEFIAKYE